MSDKYEEIEWRVKSFMASSNRLLLERLHVGSGKSTTTIKTLEENGYQWIYLCPFHVVIEENLVMSTFYTYHFMHLKSRSKECIVPAYKEIAESGLDIRPICENTCTLRETTCPYYEKKRQLRAEPCSWAGVHHHLKEFVSDFFQYYVEGDPMWRHYDVMVIDENPINVFFETKIANAATLGHLVNTMRELQLDHQDAASCQNFLQELVLSYYNANPIDYDELLKTFNSINFKTLYDSYQSKLVERIIDGKFNVANLPEEYLRVFSIMADKINEDNAPSMFVKRERDDYNAKNYYFTYFDNSALLNCPIKIIGLDGTANQLLWETITGRQASIMDKKYVYKHIYQLNNNGARYPFKSWVWQNKLRNTGTRLCDIIDKIASKKEGRVLVACTKPLQRLLEQQLKSKNIGYCNYYYIRSRNDFYETYDTIILACEPNVKPFLVDNFSVLSGWDKEVWRQIFTQEEMVQTVGRIREDKNTAPGGRKRAEREIYIFPYTPASNLENKQLYVEATVFTEDELNFFVETGKTFKMDMDRRLKEMAKRIVELDSFTTSSIRQEFNLKPGEVVSYLKEMSDRGMICVKGNKWQRRPELVEFLKTE